MKTQTRGFCQCCGNLQAVNGGKIAYHGYTKQWGFFNGSCEGSKNRPLNLHRGVLDDVIKSLNAKIEEIKNSDDLKEQKKIKSMLDYIKYMNDLAGKVLGTDLQVIAIEKAAPREILVGEVVCAQIGKLTAVSVSSTDVYWVCETGKKAKMTKRKWRNMPQA